MQVISIILILFIYLIKVVHQCQGQNAGSTDILISWVYNLTFEFNNFNMGAVVSLIIGFIVAIVAFIQFRRTSTFKDEGGL